MIVIMTETENALRDRLSRHAVNESLIGVMIDRE
jgi:hypothetical protein